MTSQRKSAKGPAPCSADPQPQTNLERAPLPNPGVADNRCPRPSSIFDGASDAIARFEERAALQLLQARRLAADLGFTEMGEGLFTVDCPHCRQFLRFTRYGKILHESLRERPCCAEAVGVLQTRLEPLRGDRDE